MPVKNLPACEINLGKKWQAQLPEKVSYPMQENGIEAGIQDNLYIPGRRVIAYDGSNMGYHSSTLYQKNKH